MWFLGRGRFFVASHEFRASFEHSEASIVRQFVFFGAIAVIFAFAVTRATAAKVTVDLGKAQGITSVGAIQRWDEDGNHKRLPDGKAKIDAPYVDASATNEGRGRWVFKNLPKGTYDFVIFAEGFRRIEGFQFVPVHEFDPFIAPTAKVEEETRDFILDHIKQSPQYENIVEPLYLAGNKKAVRVLMMLVRTKPTTFEEIPNAATIRHEVWQYSNQYGGWQKDKRTKVIDRIIMSRNDLSKWTWLWDPKLGGIEVGSKPLTIPYAMPKSGDTTLKGQYGG
jgi:hypothetical protein